MKNRIWNQAKGLAASALLFTMAVCGIWGQAAKIKASDVDNGDLRIQQSAQWTDKEKFQAEISMEISGLLAYREKYAHMMGNNTVPPEHEDEPGVTEEPADSADTTEEDDLVVEEEPVEAAEALEGDWDEIAMEEKAAYGAESEGEWFEEAWLGEELSEFSLEDEEDPAAAYREKDGFFEEEYENVPEGGEENALPQLFVENYISEYFLPVRDTLPKDSWIEEVIAENQKGEEITLAKVVYPVNPMAVTEDVLRLSFLVEVREEYRYPGQAVQYPVSQDEPLRKDCEGTGMHLLEVQGLSGTILAQGYAPVLELPEASADFTVELKAREAEVKAGNSCVYELLVTNTGGMPLKNIQIHSAFAIEETVSEDVKAVWENAQGIEVQGKQALIPELGRGETRNLYLTAQLDEGDSGRFLHKVKVQAPCPKVEGEVIEKEALTEMKVLPLTADFTVEKTADRSQAYPGDTVNYQICIRNTGERTLHSVLSTERFLGGNIQAQFLPKEGVTLNASRTQALIREIAPGQAFALQAAVVLPQYISAQELVNQVTVITEETGTKTCESQAKIQVAMQSLTPTPNIYSGYQTNYSNGNPGKSAYPVTSMPKTGDETKVGAFVMLLMLAVLTGAGVFWKRKEKSKD